MTAIIITANTSTKIQSFKYLDTDGKIITIKEGDETYLKFKFMHLTSKYLIFERSYIASSCELFFAKYTSVDRQENGDMQVKVEEREFEASSSKRNRVTGLITIKRSRVLNYEVAY